MKFEWLQIDQVRNLTSQRITPGPQINLLTGKNASGKTSILEAIYILARGRSFRTPRIQDVIQFNKKSLVVTAKIQSETTGTVISGIEKEYGRQTIRYDGIKVKTISEQARNLPLVLITQDSHGLVTGSAKYRRQWLDWAMFHVEPEYLNVWKQYMKALRQRNALLKKQEKNRELYRGWEEAMLESGSCLYRLREGFIEQLMCATNQICADVFDAPIELKQIRGWTEKKHFSEAMTDAWESDVKTGYTRVGPHQADINITSRDKGVDAIYSRGQIKLFVSLLMLAQAKVYKEKTGQELIVLVDDFTAELDASASEYLLYSLAKEAFQTFLTTVSFDRGSIKYAENLMFHVERGTVSVVVTN